MLRRDGRRHAPRPADQPPDALAGYAPEPEIPARDLPPAEKPVVTRWDEGMPEHEARGPSHALTDTAE